MKQQMKQQLKQRAAASQEQQPEQRQQRLLRRQRQQEQRQQAEAGVEGGARIVESTPVEQSTASCPTVKAIVVEAPMNSADVPKVPPSPIPAPRPP